MKNKEVSAALAAILSDMFDCDDNCEHCNNNHSYQDVIVRMINETHQIVNIIKTHDFTKTSVEAISCIIKNAILFDDEDSKIVGKKLTEQFKNDLGVIRKVLFSNFGMTINKVSGFIENFDKNDELENKTKEELIAMLRNK